MSQQLNDAILSHAINLHRLDAGLQREVLGILNKMQRDIIAQLSDGDITGWKRTRLIKALKDAEAIISDYYESAQLVLDENLAGVADVTTSATAKAITSHFAPIEIAAALPAPTLLNALATTALIEGGTYGTWWAKQEADTKFRFMNAVKQGITNGEASGTIIQRVRNVMDLSRRNAAALVQTSVNSVSNAARDATYQANADILKGYRWTGTLDSHICLRCGGRDGKIWDLEGKPVGHSLPFARPPIHFNDRCILSPVTKTFRELGFDIDEPADGQRASSDGPISAKVTFEQYLNRQSREFQDAMLGVGRADLWRSGKITLADLTNGVGRPLTLAELRAEVSGIPTPDQLVADFLPELSEQRGIERAIGYSGKGQRVFDISGTTDMIEIPSGQIAKAHGGVVAHSHPDIDSFSVDDLKIVIDHKVDTVFAVSPDGTVFSVSKVKGNTPTMYKMVDRKVATTYQDLVDNGRMSKDEFALLIPHTVNAILDNLKYTDYSVVVAGGKFNDLINKFGSVHGSAMVVISEQLK